MSAESFSIQSLAPHEARLCLRIASVSKSRLGIRPGSALLAAVSGGADSVALLLIYRLLATRLGIQLHAMHINHGLRETAVRDAEFTLSLCERLGVKCYTADIDTRRLAKEQKSGIEETARKARYKILESKAGALGAAFILVGHHAADLLEDIMMRFIRGASWPALGGMGWRNGLVARPLLHENPNRLREFVTACGYSWCEDETNKDLSYRRNRIRHLLTPILRQENPAIELNARRLHEQSLLDADYWRSEIEKILVQHGIRPDEASHEIFLPSAMLGPLHPALRIRIFSHILSNIRAALGSAGQNSAAILSSIEAAWNAGIGGKYIQCGSGVAAVISKGGIRIFRPGVKS